MTIIIRPARPEDAAALAELAARTFHETFAADNRPEDIALHLAQSYGAEHQRRELADPDMQTLLADSDHGLAGFAQLCRGPAPAYVQGEDPIELLRFYIAQPWHGRGVAQQLMAQVLTAAAHMGARTLWLGVWEHNERAKAFYRKCGFVDVGTQIYIVGSDPQHDRLMARPVAASAVARPLR
ncbi:MAG: GNAT family N-acetyltransferase [Gemmatimonadota bacterium]|nr:GNAT family N-acetyltransferase [Gemmatimonadota bacterium]